MCIYNEKDLGKCYCVIEGPVLWGLSVANKWFSLHLIVVKKISVGCFRQRLIGCSHHSFGVWTSTLHMQKLSWIYLPIGRLTHVDKFTRDLLINQNTALLICGRITPDSITRTTLIDPQGRGYKSTSDAVNRVIKLLCNCLCPSFLLSLETGLSSTILFW